ncbi:glycosyltransferase [Lichenifustis flavocetrariae]|uniref:Glycosyltransferase n=1 Tax=Lichenifustis flavocetrariae TaxID=2949735 RepID=A0AA41YU66_9HYPH|nr:glycosyltransferase [Lichenifustis flavocetrariae]MCW6507380.1 glycosyltransferase [Lichenifustis flavocetrariae]
MTITNPQDYVTVFYYGSFLPVANGGNTRLVELLDRLQDEFERLILYCYTDHPHAPWNLETDAAFRARWPGIELVLERYGGVLRWVTRAKNIAIALAPKKAAGLIATRIPGSTPLFDAVLRRSGVVILSYTEALTQVNGIDAAQCLVETHDVNFVKWSKIHQRSPMSLPALRKFRSEMALLETAGTVLAISPVEYSFFRMMLHAPRIVYVPTWAKPVPLRSPVGRTPDYDLVFVGSDYIMNVRGLCDLLAAHGSWLSRYRIAVCGRVCGVAAVRSAAVPFPNVELLGFVDHVEDVYRRSRAALSTVDGTGTKMKLLAALAAGLPVFASRQSRDGLPSGFEEAVFDMDEAHVTALLDDEPRRQEASRAALRYRAVLNESGEAAGVIAAIRARVPTNGQPQRESTRAG